MAMLEAWDYVCIALYLLATLLIGVVCSRSGQQNTRHYLLAERSISWFPNAAMPSTHT